jgi:hypothetical protein
VQYIEAQWHVDEDDGPAMEPGVERLLRDSHTQDKNLDRRVLLVELVLDFGALVCRMVGINTLHFVAESLKETLNDVLGERPIDVNDRSGLLNLDPGKECQHKRRGSKLPR